MNGSRGLRLLTTPLVGMNWEKMSEYFKSLSNTAKSRYKEKLQAVGLTIEADPYIPGNDTINTSQTTWLSGLELSMATYSPTLFSAQELIPKSNYYHINNWTPTIIFKTAMLVQCLFGSLGMVAQGAAS